MFFAFQIGELYLSSVNHACSAAQITEDMPLIRVLEILVSKRVSALPIVDAFGALKAVYAKYDAISLAYDRSYTNLDVSVKVALDARLSDEGVATCTLSSTLNQLMTDIAERHVHRIVIIDDARHILGIVSLSDLLAFLLCLKDKESAAGAPDPPALADGALAPGATTTC